MQQLYTKAGRELVGVPWQRYPRPQLVREDWQCLNGEWELGFEGKSMPIRVPFCPESLLSGVETPPKPGTELRLRRVFTVPESWQGRRVLLHFGAVMRRAVVLVNGRELGRHDNGYLPFTVDLTEALRPGKNELLVLVVNDLDRRYPWGKQRLDRGGMWYTPCSGIWQTVWLEPVPEEHIRRLRIEVGPDWAEIAVEGPSEGSVRFDGRDYPLEKGRVRLCVEDPELWSPERPRLYPFSVSCGADRVESYFALRTLSIETVDGVPRLCLNGKPYFFHGLLDQGYWSDGLYTPATPTGYTRDITAMKRLGFNTLRKHIKIEPEQFYYDCDRLGMIVFQDMVNNGGYDYLDETALPNLGFVRRRDQKRNRDPEAREIFYRSMEETVELLRNHPCICLWTIFNEGWGQFNADAAYYRLRAQDKSRFIDATSGWFHQSASDVDSLHIYFKPLRLGAENKPQLLSEFGGYCWKLPEHSFNLDKTYGYRQCADRESFVRDLRDLYEKEVLPLVSRGLCGCIYTQVSDVEDETNGLLTFDRAVEKLRPEDFADLAPRLQASLRLP
jgi:beta-galactosidase/beta-glucuronidase